MKCRCDKWQNKMWICESSSLSQKGPKSIIVEEKKKEKGGQIWFVMPESFEHNLASGPWGGDGSFMRRSWTWHNLFIKRDTGLESWTRVFTFVKWIWVQWNKFGSRLHNNIHSQLDWMTVWLLGIISSSGWEEWFQMRLQMCQRYPGSDPRWLEFTITLCLWIAKLLEVLVGILSVKVIWSNFQRGMYMYWNTYIINSCTLFFSWRVYTLFWLSLDFFNLYTEFISLFILHQRSIPVLWRPRLQLIRNPEILVINKPTHEFTDDSFKFKDESAGESVAVDGESTGQELATPTVYLRVLSTFSASSVTTIPEGV